MSSQPPPPKIIDDIPAYITALVIWIGDGDAWHPFDKNACTTFDDFAARLVRYTTAMMVSVGTLRHLHERLYQIAKWCISQKGTYFGPAFSFMVVPPVNTKAVYLLSKRATEEYFMALLRSRLPLYIRRPSSTPVQDFVWFAVQQRWLRKIGRTPFDRRGARMAVIVPGVRQLLRRTNDGNKLAGVFQRQDVASVVAEYLGYAAW